MAKVLPTSDAMTKGFVIVVLSLVIINYTKGFYPQPVRNAIGV